MGAIIAIFVCGAIAGLIDNLAVSVEEKRRNR
jgi:hypothetical protein